MIKKIYYICLQRIYVIIKKIKRILLKEKNTSKILMFHEINDSRGGLYAVSQDNFKKVINYIGNNDLCATIDCIKDNDKIIVTFDDAYESVYLYARPVLKEKNIPYYVFLCNELIDTDGYLNTKQVEEMINDGNCIIGSHLYRHEMSRFKKEENLDKMMIDSKKELEKKFKININCLAFPYGSFYAVSKKNIELAKKHFDYIFTTIPLNYSKRYGNIIPRYNMNDNEIQKVINKNV